MRLLCPTVVGRQSEVDLLAGRLDMLVMRGRAVPSVQYRPLTEALLGVLRTAALPGTPESAPYRGGVVAQRLAEGRVAFDGALDQTMHGDSGAGDGDQAGVLRAPKTSSMPVMAALTTGLGSQLR